MAIVANDRGKRLIFGLLALSLVGAVLLPTGQVISLVVIDDVSGVNDQSELVEVGVQPLTTASAQMDSVVRLQMREVHTPDGVSYRVLGAALRSVTDDGGASCVAILQGYAGTASCATVLQWAVQ